MKYKLPGNLEVQTIWVSLLLTSLELLECIRLGQARSRFQIVVTTAERLCARHHKQQRCIQSLGHELVLR
jgi:hypothetical protein